MEEGADLTGGRPSAITRIRVGVLRKAGGTTLRLCRFTDDLVGVDSKERLALRRRVAGGEGVRLRRAEDAHGLLTVPTIGLAIVVEKVDRAVHDHAVPVQPAAYLVDFERNPRMMLHGRQLVSRRRASVQPSVCEDVRDRLDVDAV